LKSDADALELISGRYGDGEGLLPLDLARSGQFHKMAVALAGEEEES